MTSPKELPLTLAYYDDAKQDYTRAEMPAPPAGFATVAAAIQWAETNAPSLTCLCITEINPDGERDYDGSLEIVGSCTLDEARNGGYTTIPPAY